MDKYLVSVKQYGRGIEVSYGDTYPNWDEAISALWKKVEGFGGGGQRVVIIAERGENGKFGKGLYGLNTIYQVTVTKE